jgi:HSP20 family protein
MAESKTNKSEQSERTKESGQSQGQGQSQSITRQDQPRRGMQRGEPASGLSYANPLFLMNQMTEEMDRVFDRVFQGWGMPRRSSLSRSPLEPISREGIWTPKIEAFQQGDRFIVRAELPGLKKDDVQIELTNDALTIRGERQEQHEEEREGYYHSEREYGQFYRVIPLPEGVISESAQASFRDGVLEVTMQAAPSEANRGRRLEIKDESGSSDKK